MGCAILNHSTIINHKFIYVNNQQIIHSKKENYQYSYTSFFCLETNKTKLVYFVINRRFEPDSYTENSENGGKNQKREKTKFFRM